MNRQTLIALGVAVVLGIIAVIVANAYLTGRERQLASSPEGMVRIAVAAMPLNYGDDVTPDKVKFVQYPTASSLLLPVANASQPRRLLCVIMTAPRMRACRFCSVSPPGSERRSSSTCGKDSYAACTESIGI